VLALILLYPSIAAASNVAIRSGLKDPQIVVVDEVLGQWITLAGANGSQLEIVPAGFWLLFRLFDIFKPPPIRRLERIPGVRALCWTTAGRSVWRDCAGCRRPVRPLLTRGAKMRLGQNIA